jgi:hypothetical protein
MDTNFEDDENDVTKMMVVVSMMMMIIIIIFSKIPGCKIQILNNGNSKDHY